MAASASARSHSVLTEKNTSVLSYASPALERRARDPDPAPVLAMPESVPRPSTDTMFSRVRSANWSPKYRSVYHSAQRKVVCPRKLLKTLGGIKLSVRPYSTALWLAVSCTTCGGLTTTVRVAVTPRFPDRSCAL